jgi:hypothetical protein
MPDERLLRDLGAAFDGLVTFFDPPKDRAPFGALSARGCDQMHDLGRALRRRYEELCPEMFRSPIAPRMQVWSSNYARTQRSAQCALLGFLLGDAHPDAASAAAAAAAAAAEGARTPLPQIVARRVLDDPIDTFSRYPEIGARVADVVGRDAPAFLAQEKALGLTADVKERFVACLPGLPLDGWSRASPKPFLWFPVADALFCRAEHAGRNSKFAAREASTGVPAGGRDLGDCDSSRPAPAALDPAVAARADAAHDLLTWRFGRYYADPELFAFAVGDLVAELSDRLDGARKREGTPGTPGHPRAGAEEAPRIDWYSGHDVTLMPLLRALGAWDGRWPPYGSWAALEHYEVDAAAEGGVAGTSRAAVWETRLVFNGAELAVLDGDALRRAGDRAMAPRRAREETGGGGMRAP